MIAADKTFIVPVVLILFDDAHETFNIRFYLRFLFDFKERDDLLCISSIFPSSCSIENRATAIIIVAGLNAAAVCVVAVIAPAFAAEPF